MKRKILSVLMAAVMIMLLMPVITHAAANGTCGENLTWTLDDNGTLTISGTGEMTDYEARPNWKRWSGSLKQQK